MTSNAVPLPDSPEHVGCADFLAFQQVLKRWRDVDDKVIYRLNSVIPTASFSKNVDVHDRCAEFYDMLQHAYETRDTSIQKCITESQSIIERLKQQRDADENNIDVLKQLRTQQTQLRMLQSELNIEEVVRDRTMKAFSERCRLAFDIPNSGRLK